MQSSCDRTAGPPRGWEKGGAETPPETRRRYKQCRKCGVRGTRQEGEEDDWWCVRHGPGGERAGSKAARGLGVLDAASSATAGHGGEGAQDAGQSAREHAAEAGDGAEQRTTGDGSFGPQLPAGFEPAPRTGRKSGRRVDRTDEELEAESSEHSESDGATESEAGGMVDDDQELLDYLDGDDD